MKKKVIHVQSGENLAALLKAFPEAEVHTLISSPGEDAWRVEIPGEILEATAAGIPRGPDLGDPATMAGPEEGSPGTLILTSRKRPQRRTKTTQGDDHVHEWSKIRKPKMGWAYRCKVCGQKARESTVNGE